MNTQKNIVRKLNILVRTYSWDKSICLNLMNNAFTNYDTVAIIRFWKYNQLVLDTYKYHKLELVKKADFETAKYWRDKEKKALRFIKMLKTHNISQSCFIEEEGKLFYCYMNKNDIDSYIYLQLIKFPNCVIK